MKNAPLISGLRVPDAYKNMHKEPPENQYEKDIKYIYFQGQLNAHLQSIIYHQKEQQKIELLMEKLKE